MVQMTVLPGDFEGAGEAIGGMVGNWNNPQREMAALRHAIQLANFQQQQRASEQQMEFERQKQPFELQKLQHDAVNANLQNDAIRTAREAARHAALAQPTGVPTGPVDPNKILPNGLTHQQEMERLQREQAQVLGPARADFAGAIATGLAKPSKEVLTHLGPSFGTMGSPGAPMAVPAGTDPEKLAEYRAKNYAEGEKQLAESAERAQASLPNVQRAIDAYTALQEQGGIGPWQGAIGPIKDRYLPDWAGGNRQLGLLYDEWDRVSRELELAKAQAMRGQGQITEAERLLLRLTLPRLDEVSGAAGLQTLKMEMDKIKGALAEAARSREQGAPSPYAPIEVPPAQPRTPFGSPVVQPQGGAQGRTRLRYNPATGDFE